MFKKLLIVTLVLAGSLSSVLTAGANSQNAISENVTLGDNFNVDGYSSMEKARKTRTATATLRPTATATARSTSTATPRPTATATVRPTNTATLRPTATATARPTSTATPRPTATATPNPTATAMPTTTPGATKLYWGAWISDNHLTAPYDYGSETQLGILGTFESRTGKKVSIIHFGQAWKDGSGAYNSFSVVTNRSGNNPVSGLFDKIRAHGAIPLLDWASWQIGAGNSQPNFSLATILTGVYDTYITQWAHDAAAWGHPFFIRFDWEPNGNWFPWGTKDGFNGNSAAQYVAVWRHVHDIFVAQGATNVTWVWCMNKDYPGATPIASLYPGAAYVDWTAVDGYNWSVDKSGVWQSFTEVCGPTYTILNTVAPGKPIMIAEVGTSKDRPATDTNAQHTKPNWISSLLTTELPLTFPNVRAVVWFNWDAGSTILDWPIEGNSYSIAGGAAIDQAAIDAFKSGIANSRYASNVFSNLSASPIMPPR